jgi:hypothetical protein
MRVARGAVRYGMQERLHSFTAIHMSRFGCLGTSAGLVYVSSLTPYNGSQALVRSWDSDTDRLTGTGHELLRSTERQALRSARSKPQTAVRRPLPAGGRVGLSAVSALRRDLLFALGGSWVVLSWCSCRCSPRGGPPHCHIPRLVGTAVSCPSGASSRCLGGWGGGPGVVAPAERLLESQCLVRVARWLHP